MGADFVEMPRRVRVALSLAALAVALLLLSLLVSLVVGLGSTGEFLHRWGNSATGAIAAAGALTRIALVERERRAWIPLGAGLASFACGSFVWAAFYWSDPNAPLPSPADGLWLS